MRIIFENGRSCKLNTAGFITLAYLVFSNYSDESIEKDEDGRCITDVIGQVCIDSLEDVWNFMKQNSEEESEGK